MNCTVLLILYDSYYMTHTVCVKWIEIVAVLLDFLLQSSPKRNCISSSRITLHFTMLRVSGIKSFPALLFHFLNHWDGGRPRNRVYYWPHSGQWLRYRYFLKDFYLAWISFTISLLFNLLEADVNTPLIYWYRFIPVLTGKYIQKYTNSRNNSLTP